MPKNREVTDWLSGQYALARQALTDLGFEEQDGIFPFEAVRDSVDTEIENLHASRIQVGQSDELVIVPSVHSIGLFGDLDTFNVDRRGGGDLLHRFDREQDKRFATTIQGHLISVWREYNDVSDIHDNGSSTPFSVAILLGCAVDTGGNHGAHRKHGELEPGLVNTNMNYAEQRAALAAEQDEHRAYYPNAKHELMGATIGQIVMVNASRRAAGILFLDQKTATRLIHYPPTTQQRSRAYIPAVTSSRILRRSRGRAIHYTK
jgi:hypothetical protein